MEFMLNRQLSEALFEGFFIQRWNDRIRPVNLTESDKNSSKMMLTLYIGKKIEDSGRQVNWFDLVNKGIFDALVRYAISDISSVVHAKLRQDKDLYVSSISKIIEKQYGKILPSEMMDNFKDYIKYEKQDRLSQEDIIIRLSHGISLDLEFKIVSSLGYGSFFLDHEEDGKENIQRIIHHTNELGLNSIIEVSQDEKITYSSDLDLILKLIDRLRYQVRWSQTPRVPQTSVLGHSFYVACCVYFATVKLHTPMRVVNNFYAGLMHDFLEALTRDIISPVKNSSTEFKQQIAKIEIDMLKKHLLPNLNGNYKNYLNVLLENEFSNRAFDEKGIIDFENADDSQKIDGQIIQAADYYAALLEAYQSINLGISSHHLVGATSRLYATFKAMEKNFADKDMYAEFLDLYDDFISR